ncbi:MAG: oligoendopeptidase F [Desulfobacterales bacterium]|nr:MAG: oligoendopeptidase F [Desulfobacterales bacterium]
MENQSKDVLGTKDVIWELGDLYSSEDDPALEYDIKLCQKQAAEVAQQYAGKVGELSAQELFALVSALEAIDTMLGKLGTYGYLNFSTQTASGAASGLLQRIEELGAEIGKATLFFRLEWNSLAEDHCEGLLQDEVLKQYKHYLQALRRFAPYQLSETEEGILQEFGPVGRSAWNVLFDKVMGQMRFGKQGRSEEEVLSDLYAAERETRKVAAQEMTDALNDNEHILTHIFNTLAAEKMIVDRVRKYESWNSAIHLSNELEALTVNTLVDEVTSSYGLVHRYYTYKKTLLGYEELFDYDRYAPVLCDGEELIPWAECKTIVLDAFSAFSAEMGEIAERFFSHNWIHGPIMDGKRGGAFAHPCVPEVHPYVMVNYAGTMRDVATVAHELGHGVHQYLAAGKGYYNSDTPLVLAETASVFAEFLVFNTQLELIEDEKQRRAFICQKIESIFATVFRQIAMNRFEDKMHTLRREKGELSKEEYAGIWLDTQQAMFGDAVTLTENYGIWWSYIPHFLGTPGYVYSYAFGELLVLALYAQYQQQGAPFVEQYRELLAAGGSRSPYELVQPFGIDLDDPAFWQGGITIIESLLDKLGA